MRKIIALVVVVIGTWGTGYGAKTVGEFLTKKGLQPVQTFQNNTKVYNIPVQGQGESYCGYHALKNLIVSYWLFEKPSNGDTSYAIFSTGFSPSEQTINFYGSDQQSLLSWKDLLNGSDQQNSFTLFQNDTYYKGVLSQTFIPVILAKYPQTLRQNTIVLSTRMTNFTSYQPEFPNFLKYYEFKPIYDFLSSPERSWLGTLIQLNDRHFVSAAFIREKGENIVLCFDSMGNVGVKDKPEVIGLITYMSNQDHGKKYFDDCLNAQTQKLLAELGDSSKLMQKLLYKGTRLTCEAVTIPLTLFVSIVSSDLKESFKTLLKNNGRRDALKKALHDVIEKYNKEIKASIIAWKPDFVKKQHYDVKLETDEDLTPEKSHRVIGDLWLMQKELFPEDQIPPDPLETALALLKAKLLSLAQSLAT